MRREATVCDGAYDEAYDEAYGEAYGEAYATQIPTGQMN